MDGGDRCRADGDQFAWLGRFEGDAFDFVGCFDRHPAGKLSGEDLQVIFEMPWLWLVGENLVHEAGAADGCELSTICK